MKNKKYIQIIEQQNWKYDIKNNCTYKCRSYYKEKLGSDAVFIVDQRHKYWSIVNIANKYIKNNKFKYYQIRYWTLENFTILHYNYSYYEKQI